jgi:hypothetical protein
VPFVQLGGFGGWQKAKHAVWALKEILDLDISVFCLFDKDFRPSEEIDLFEAKFREDGLNCVVLRRKEIENYLLDVDAIEWAIRRRAAEKNLHFPTKAELEDWLDQITANMKPRIFAQTLEKWELFIRRDTPKTDLLMARQTCEANFERQWSTFGGRIALSPGKEVLSRLNERFQDEGLGNLTANMILQGMKDDSIDPFFAEMLQSLDKFCE